MEEEGSGRSPTGYSMRLTGSDALGVAYNSLARTSHMVACVCKGFRKCHSGTCWKVGRVQTVTRTVCAIERRIGGEATEQQKWEDLL